MAQSGGMPLRVESVRYVSNWRKGRIRVEWWMLSR
jgi:hypothetical protein